jgi:hypothetical protein
MCLSHAYGTPPDADTAARVLHRALDLGYTHLDSAALYGFGANETLINPRTVSGARYAPAVQAEIDTEELTATTT